MESVSRLTMGVGFSGDDIGVDCQPDVSRSTQTIEAQENRTAGIASVESGTFRQIELVADYDLCSAADFRHGNRVVDDIPERQSR